MTVKLFNTKKVRAFLEVLEAYAHDDRGINRSDVSLVIGPREDTTVATLTVARCPDDRANSVTVLNCCYHQEFSAKSAASDGALVLRKKDINELLEVAAEHSWRSLTIGVSHKGGFVEVDGKTRTPLTSVEESNELPSAPDGTNASASKEDTSGAIEACASMPPLDSTKRGDVRLSIADGTLTVTRTAGEARFDRCLVIRGASQPDALAQVPHEVVPVLVKHLKETPGRTVRVHVSSHGGISLQTAYGVASFHDYAGRRDAALDVADERIAFFSLSSRQLATLENIVRSTQAVAFDDALELHVSSKGLKVLGRRGQLLSGSTFNVQSDRLIVKKDTTLYLRPGSLLSLLSAAKTNRRQPYGFYVFACGTLVYRGKETCCVAHAGKVTTGHAQDDSRVILWASGGDPKLIAESPHRHILLSFAELPKRVRKKRGEFERHLDKLRLLDGEMKVFLDSGAYSVWRSGAEVDLAEYIRFLKWNSLLLDTYVALDKIRGTVKENVERYRVMVDAGLNPLYVWHLYEDFDLLDQLLDDYREAIQLGGIGSGGAPHTPDPIREPYICELFWRVHDKLFTKIHLFGTTSEWILKKYATVYSADSTSWRFLGQNQTIQTPFGQFSTKPNGRRSIWGHRLFGEIAKFVASLPFRSRDVTLESMAEKSKDRHLYNLAYLSFFEEHHPWIDWMKLEQRCIPSAELKARDRLVLSNSAILFPASRLKRTPRLAA